MEKKKQITDRLLNAWNQNPSLRLGQLLENSKPNELDDLFYIDDSRLIASIEKFSYGGESFPTDNEKKVTDLKNKCKNKLKELTQPKLTKDFNNPYHKEIISAYQDVLNILNGYGTL
jgi:hypothetical protein